MNRLGKALGLNGPIIGTSGETWAKLSKEWAAGAKDEIDAFIRKEGKNWQEIEKPNLQHGTKINYHE